MAYQFKIIKLPLNGTLFIESGVKAKINIPYPITKQATMYFSPKYKVPSEPYSKFIYQIKPTADEGWSDDIDMEINIQPTAGAATCVSNTFPVTFISKNNISSKIAIEDTEDRIRVTEVEYGTMITVDGDPLEINKVYMAYQWRNIYFVSPSPETYSDPLEETRHSIIHYQTGDKNGWNTGCTFTINKSYQAYLNERSKVALSSTIDSEGVEKVKGLYTFKKSISILGGIPNATVKLRVSKTFPWAYAEFITDQGTIELNQDITDITSYDNPANTLVTLDDTGSLYATIEGTPLLESGEENFGFNVELELLSINGTHNYVDDAKDTILLSFYSHPDYAVDYNVIYKLLFTSDSFATTSDISSAISGVIASGTLDFKVNVSMYSNKGVPPFLYEIISTDGEASTITNPKYVNQFNISGLVSSTVSPGKNHKFEVRVTDSNKILSKEVFEINVLEDAAITIPTNVGLTIAAGTIYEGDNISADITADNNPTSYRAVNLPSGLVLNTNTGHISGSIATAGTYNIDLYASNEAGESATSFSWVLTIAAAINLAPVIVLNEPYSGYLGDDFNFETIVTDPTGVTYSFPDYPDGWKTYSDGKVLMGVLGSNNSFTIRAENEYGYDQKYVTVFITQP